MPKKSNTTEQIYSWVCKNPGMCTYDFEKKLKMSGGRVRHALSMLEKKGLIKFKWERNSPRIKKLTFPVEAFSLLPKKMWKDLKKIKRR